MITLVAKCPRCGTEIHPKVDPICPQEWVEKLFPMVHCNRCYDTQRAQEEAERKKKTSWWKTLGIK